MKVKEEKEKKKLPIRIQGKTFQYKNF